MATPRKKQTKKVVTVRDEDYTALEMHAIKLNEMYKAFRKAGFPVDQSLWLISEPGALPEWLQPIPSLEPYDDEEEDF